MRILVTGLVIAQLASILASSQVESSTQKQVTPVESEVREKELNLESPQRELRWGKRKRKNKSRYNNNWNGSWSSRSYYNYDYDDYDDHRDYDNNYDYDDDHDDSYYTETETEPYQYPSNASLNQSSSSSSSNKSALISGIVVAVIATTILGIIICVCCKQRKKRVSVAQYTQAASSESAFYGRKDNSLGFKQLEYHSRPSSASSLAVSFRSNSLRSSQVQSTCSICLDTIEKRAEKVLQCGHSFHARCIRAWGQRLNVPTCPLCRHNI